MAGESAEDMVVVESIEVDDVRDRELRRVIMLVRGIDGLVMARCPDGQESYYMDDRSISQHGRLDLGREGQYADDTVYSMHDAIVRQGISRRLLPLFPLTRARLHERTYERDGHYVIMSRDLHLVSSHQGGSNRG